MGEAGAIFRAVGAVLAVFNVILVVWLNRPAAMRAKVVAGVVDESDLIVKIGYAIIMGFLAAGFIYGIAKKLPVNPAVFPIVLALGLVFIGKVRMALRGRRPR
jgi:p-aminobenzoyl-glutamate transporter AbgT